MSSTRAKRVPASRPEGGSAAAPRAGAPPSRRLVGGAALAGLLTLIGCAGSGPRVLPGEATARIVERNFRERPDTAQIFHVAAIDGVAVRSSLEATQQASSGAEVIALQTFEHRVLARPLRLTLAGTHLTATPAQSERLRSSGDFFQIRGEVTFTPAPGGRYFVAGELKRTGSSLWIADLGTGQRVSERVTSGL